ncbi:MAG: trypsin-like peptidase domain-containing protein [Alphaproteobacteria bacterium]
MQKIVVLLAIGFCLCVSDAFAARVRDAAPPRANNATTRASFSGALTDVTPAVVNIFTEKVVARRVVNPMFDDPLFRDFVANAVPVQKRMENSLGSGVIVSPDGLIITNLHVIEGATDIKVVFNDGRDAEAKYIGGDKDLDIAILRLNLGQGQQVPYAKFGDSDSLTVGDVVLAIGNPYGVGQSVSMGIVSAVARGNAQLSQLGNYIQTDAAINPGNSGGALVDSTGRVVGINTAIFSKNGGGSLGIGFATPASVVKAVVEDIVTSGKVRRPWLGATGQDLTAELATQLGLPTPQGVMVNELAPQGPAANAGVQIGDVILALDGQPVANTRGFNARILTTPQLAGRKVPLTLWRAGQNLDVQVQFESIPDREPSSQLVIEGDSPLTGYVVEKLSPTLNQELSLPLATEGLAVVGVPAQVKGVAGLYLKVGDILQEVNGRPMATLVDVAAAVARRPQQWKITYQRGERVFRVIVQ